MIMCISDYNFRLDHIGINEPNMEEAQKIVSFFQMVFGFSTRETPTAIFANEQFEIMRAPGRGRLGHFAISTKDVLNAQQFLESQGLKFDESSSTYNSSGEKIVIYAKDEVSGFAWHLMKRD